MVSDDGLSELVKDYFLSLKKGSKGSSVRQILYNAKNRRYPVELLKLKEADWSVKADVKIPAFGFRDEFSFQVSNMKELKEVLLCYRFLKRGLFSPNIIVSLAGNVFMIGNDSLVHFDALFR